MNVKSLKYTCSSRTHTHTFTHMHREHGRCVWRESGALGVHENYPLGDATLSECGRHSYSALVYTNVSYFGSDTSPPLRASGPGPGPGLPSPGPLSQGRERMKIQDSVGWEISNNQKPRLHNVHLYHNILTLLLLLLLLLHTAWQHLCSMCLS